MAKIVYITMLIRQIERYQHPAVSDSITGRIMRYIERFPLTSGPKTFNPNRKKIVFRSETVGILFIVEKYKLERNNSITFWGKTRVRGCPEPTAIANFTPKGQHGWIKYP